MAHSDALRQRSTSVAFGAKRTSIKPRWGNPRRPTGRVEDEVVKRSHTR